MSAHKPQNYLSALRAERRRKVAQIVAYALIGGLLGLAAFCAGYWASSRTDSLTTDSCVVDFQLPTLDQGSK